MVEALISGDEEKVSKLLEWCHRGPEMAKVEKADVKRQCSGKGFHIRYS